MPIIRPTQSPSSPTECYRGVMDETEQGPITGGSFVNVEWDLLPVNTKGGTPLNTSTGIFTVPTGMGGTWDVQAQLRLFAMDPGGGEYTFTIEKKDADPFSGAIAIVEADADEHSIGAAWRAELAAGDEIVATLRCPAGYNLTKIDGDGAYSWIDYTFHPR